MDCTVQNSLKVVLGCRASHLATLLILLVIPALAFPAAMTAPSTLYQFTNDVPPAISFVQATSATPQTSTATVSVNYPSAQTPTIDYSPDQIDKQDDQPDLLSAQWFVQPHASLKRWLDLQSTGRA